MITTSDCSVVTQCKIVRGSPVLVTIRKQKCHKNARCVPRNGGYKCVCKKFFKGNGVDVCKSKFEKLSMMIKLDNSLVLYDIFNSSDLRNSVQSQ